MRLVILGSLALLGGCISDWEAHGIPSGDLPENLYFADEDGDGWGDPADPGAPASEPPAQSARNNRDCDDTDAGVTGRTGVICPEQLVAFEEASTKFAPVATGGSEFVLVRAPTEVAWAGLAESACGPNGWGGRLATFTSEAELETVLAGLDPAVTESPADDALDDQRVWAGYVGFAPQGDAWGHRDEADPGTWVEDTSGMSVVASRFCSPRETYTEDLAYLALVRDGAPDDGAFDPDSWCLGTPDEALPATIGDEPDYGLLYGHFICERPIPDATLYEVGEPPQSE